MRRIRRIPIKKENEIMQYIDMIFYINLDKRKDRKESIEKEIKKIDPGLKKTKRISAIEHDPGAIGCGLSHIKVLEEAIEKNYENILILEDDFKFIKGKRFDKFPESFNHLMNKYPDYNICLLSANVRSFRPLDNLISEVGDAQTTAGYLINKRFFKTLKNCFNTAVTKMKKNYVYTEAEIDVEWKTLQGNGKNFYIFNLKPGYQMDSYSDIEKKFVTYHC